MKNSVQQNDLIAISTDNWSASFRRTSQIMSRFARYRRVYYVETPILGVAEVARYRLRETRDDVVVIETYLPAKLTAIEQNDAVRELLLQFISEHGVFDYTLWTDTPKSVPLFRGLSPKALIYDCVQDYSATHAELEREIFEKADLVFTSSNSLYTAKRTLHPNIHNNPDCIDYRHFYQARFLEEGPADQEDIPHPRIGFSGVIDHRIDFELLIHLATMRPDVHFILLGEFRIPEESLPKMHNIHFLGAKSYSKLPLYLAGWDASFVPYKACDETRFLNPGFISESLVGGSPVISTPLKDVVETYDGQNLIHIAEFPIDFERAISSAIEEKQSALWLNKVDQQFKGSSWEKGCMRLAALEKDLFTITAQSSLPKVFRQFFTTVESEV